jgi:hypothetical protein
MFASLTGVVIVNLIHIVQPTTTAWQDINRTLMSTEAMPLLERNDNGSWSSFVSLVLIPLHSPTAWCWQQYKWSMDRIE